MLCVGFGLTLRTQIPIPGAMAAASGEPVDIEIGYGAPAPWTERVAWGPYRVVDADLFDFTMPGLARYTVNDRRRITLTPDKSASEEDIAAMLIATVLPALLWSRGEVVLHAAAASRSATGPGWLLLGDSGSGKSTRLLRAIGAGALAIGDDSVCLRMEGDRVIASGLPGGVFARRAGQGGSRDLIATSADRQVRACPVTVGCLIDTTGQPRRRFDGLNGLAALLRHRHRPRILQLLGTEADTIAPLARIAKHLRLIRLQL
jgi:hypothetical protein